MKKRPFFLFSILLCSVLTFISCAHDTPQNASVSFLMSRETIHAILQRASRVNTSRSKNVELSQTYDFDDSEGERSEARVLVKLLYDGTATEKTLEETEEGFEATFTGIAIGSRVKAEVYLYIDDFLFMTGTSEEQVVVAGTNTLNVRMEDAVSGGGGSGDSGGGGSEESHESGDTGESGGASEGSGDSGHTGGESEQTYPADGTIELHITRFKLSKNTTLSSSTFYQNYGTLVLSLFDEDDEETDIFADIDWDNADNQEKFHDNITCTAKYGTTEIDLVLRNNTISMDYETPAGFTGRCQVFVTVTSDSIENYVNTSGDVVDLPFFEPVTASFNIDVEKGIVIDVGELHDLGEYAEYPGIDINEDFEGYHTFNTLTIGINNILKNSNPFVLSPKIILKGSTDLTYTDFMKGVLFSMSYFDSVVYDIDMSGVTTESEADDATKIEQMNGDNGIAVYNSLPNSMVCENVNSILFPADLTEIGESAFSGWEALNSVSFPENSALKIIGKYAFMSCPTLEITLPGNLIAIASRAFYCSSNLNPNLTINLADSSGTWYYAGNNETVGEDQWNAWLAGTQTPPDHDSSVVCGEESDIVNALKTTTTGNIYWFRVKD